MNVREALVVTPTLNEAAGIEEHVQDVFRAAPEISMLVVDDASDDGTAARVESLAQRFPRLFLVARTGTRSFAGSYRDGFNWAVMRGFSAVISMDADRSHPAEAIPELLRAAEGADLVVASRYLRGVSVRNWPLRRVILSAIANSYARAVTSLDCSDLTSGFCLYRRELLENALLRGAFSSGYAFLIEMKYRAWRAGARIEEVPYTFVERRLGSSKMSSRRLLEGVIAPIWCRLALGRPSREIRQRADSAAAGTRRQGKTSG